MSKMKNKTLLPVIAAPVQRTLINFTTPNSCSQGNVEAAIYYPGITIPGIPFAYDDAD
ncbi:hypothetical protein RIVM261_062750 [Rivularia sp. IAM M-261]|nr:hypothetical protein CAL7716_048930 [Calothrix sp. PCC 7716]GJD21319.1 hypothetical protein RIVM261_062750 [Rivularia sp. IAM M-261]